MVSVREFGSFGSSSMAFVMALLAIIGCVMTPEEWETFWLSKFAILTKSKLSSAPQKERLRSKFDTHIEWASLQRCAPAFTSLIFFFGNGPFVLEF